MRIGVVSTLYPSPGNPAAGIFVKEELDNLARAVEIRLIAPFPNQHWLYGRGWKTGAGQSPYPIVRPFALAFPRWFMQRCYPSSLALTLRLAGSGFFDGCDIIHAHNAFPEGVAAVRAFGERFPVIVTVHGSDVNYFAMKRQLKPGIVGALNRSRRVICVGSALSKTLKRLGVTTETVVIPNGIDTALLAQGNKEHASQHLGLDPKRPRILFAGNFVAVKGIEYLIEAMPAVLEQYPECELILLGAAPGETDRRGYERLIARYGIGHSVKIVERVPHEKLPPWIHASDALVLPSIHEGFGLVAVEALACGRPVVSTLSGGPEDIVEPGTGVLVPPKDADALAKAIVHVLRGDGIVNADMLAESARSRFSYGAVTEKILDVYKSVLY